MMFFMFCAECDRLLTEYASVSELRMLMSVRASLKELGSSTRRNIAN